MFFTISGSFIKSPILQQGYVPYGEARKQLRVWARELDYMAESHSVTNWLGGSSYIPYL
jgi:hypothetical protein